MSMIFPLRYRKPFFDFHIYHNIFPANNQTAAAAAAKKFRDNKHAFNIHLRARRAGDMQIDSQIHIQRRMFRYQRAKIF
jgi:hypothetical protein